MAKYGSNTVTITYDGDDLSAHILSINGVKVMSMFESDTHGFNKVWAETLATGMKRAEPVEVEGFYDDVADGPHASFKDTAAGPGTATKNIVFLWGQREDDHLQGVGRELRAAAESWPADPLQGASVAERFRRRSITGRASPAWPGRRTAATWGFLHLCGATDKGAMRMWTPYRKNLEKTIIIPDSDGATMVIQKIGKVGLAEAAFVLQKKALEKIRDLGGAELLGSMRSITGQGVKTQDEAKAIADMAVASDPTLVYDHATLIQMGTKTPPEGFEIKSEDIAMLDPGFVAWLARAIYDLEMEDTPKKD